MFIRNYPKTKTEPGQLRASAHTDYGTMTILLQDHTGGLQVQHRNEEEEIWMDATPLPGTLVVNLGDLMARWTNDKWVSTLHRVVEPTGVALQRRQSIAYFQNINADTLVECIPTCTSDKNPPKYAPIVAFDHLLSKHNASLNM